MLSRLVANAIFGVGSVVLIIIIGAVAGLVVGGIVYGLYLAF